jgi:hypothetical protein
MEFVSIQMLLERQDIVPWHDHDDTYLKRNKPGFLMIRKSHGGP